MVVDFFSSIHAQYHIAHFLVAELHNLVIQQYTIGGKRKAELLIMKSFLLPAVFHQVLHYFPVHQWLSAKEIHLQVTSGAGIGDQEIQCLFPNFK